MLFGLIKTKKDKRIEELEREMLVFKALPPTIVHQFDTKRFKASVSLNPSEVKNISQEFIKKEIAHKIADELVNYIEYTKRDSGIYGQVIEGEITIVDKKEKWNSY